MVCYFVSFKVVQPNVALPHECQLLIVRGTQKPVACHELACPLEALSKPN